jgi:hypothetical protein
VNPLGIGRDQLQSNAGTAGVADHVCPLDTSSPKHLGKVSSAAEQAQLPALVSALPVTGPMRAHDTASG